MTTSMHEPRHRRASRIAGRACLLLGLAAGLAACANAVAPTPPVSGYGFGNLSGVDAAAFGRRTSTPGYTFDRGGGGGGA